MSEALKFRELPLDEARIKYAEGMDIVKGIIFQIELNTLPEFREDIIGVKDSMIKVLEGLYEDITRRSNGESVKKS